MPPAVHLPIPINVYGASVPVYRRPQLIHTYSHLSSRAIAHDDASMAYYKAAPVGCDLTEGFERRIEREDVDEHLDGLVESLEIMGRNGEKAERRGGIITWRGMLTRLLTAPYERDPWQMNAIALDGSVYLELWDPPEARAKKKNDEASWAKQAYMGYGYESFSTIDTGEKPSSRAAGWGGDVDTNVQWANVVRSAIGEIPLCLAGEVDCVKASPGEPNPGLPCTVELKTNKIITNARQDAAFRKKLVKHWAQSWLLGIPEVVVGFRDDRGILQSQRTYETEKIPNLVASQRPAPWSPNTCLQSLHAVCALLTTHVLPTDPLVSYPQVRGNPAVVEAAGGMLPPAVVWRLDFNPPNGFSLNVIGEAGTVDGRWGGILKEGYVKWRMSVE